MGVCVCVHVSEGHGTKVSTSCAEGIATVKAASPECYLLARA